MQSFKTLVKIFLFTCCGYQVNAQQLPIANDQYHLYGPNSHWNEFLQVGGNGRVTPYASVAATNGNLHLDSKNGAGYSIYLNHYSQGNTLLNTQGGNVGIGTYTPINKFQVNSTNNGTGTIDWIAGNFGGTAGDRAVMGVLKGVASIGGHNNALNAWANFSINPDGGNVGIGTVDPSMGGTTLSRFTIAQADGNTGLTIGNFSGIPRLAINGRSNGSFTMYDYASGQHNAGITQKSGNVGIGTDAPSGKLHVAGSFAGGVLQDQNDRPSIGVTGSYPQAVLMSGNIENPNHGPTLMLGSFDSGTSGAHKHWSIGTAGKGSTFLDFGFSDTDLNPHAGVRNYNGSTIMTLLHTGKVGIGTTIPDEKLTVKGKIHAEEVKVDLNVPGPDYVFEKDYDLKSLPETEKFIAENKHLPEVPSAKEMEENGLSLGEMQMKLLQKVEELTLHLIELNKKFEAQEIRHQKEIEELKMKK